jgi:hypothetical protein
MSLGDTALLGFIVSWRQSSNDQVVPALSAELEDELSSAQQEAVAEAKNRAELAANSMFQQYTNLLSINAKYVWNKIVHEQTASDPCTDLQAVLRKDPGDFHTSCLMTA